MKTYRITIRPTSSFSSPLEADTLWGHLCWAIKYIDGEDKLNTFLSEYQSGAPLLISNGFLHNFIPLPILKPLTKEDIYSMFEKFKTLFDNLRFNFLNGIKRLKKVNLIHWEVFNKHRENFSLKKLYREVLELKICPDNFRPKPHSCKISSIKECPFINPASEYNCPLTPVYKNMEISHNTIDRISGKSLEEGGLFFEKTTFHLPGTLIDIFISTDFFDKERLYKLFEFIFKKGYGRFSSKGKGQGVIEKIEEFVINPEGEFNAFISLSPFVPSNSDEINGLYNIITKYPKLGLEYSKEPFDNFSKAIPWKKPVIMFTAGSTFRVNSKKDYFGSLLTSVHFSPLIKHYAFAFPVYFKPAEGEFI